MIIVNHIYLLLSHVLNQIHSFWEGKGVEQSGHDG